MTRSVQPVLITVFFVVMMGLLLRDHLLPALLHGKQLRVDTRLVDDSWVDRDDYLSVNVAGTERGGLRINSIKLSDNPARYLFTAKLQLELPVATGILSVGAIADRRLELEQFQARVHLGSDPEAETRDPLVQISGVVSGQELLLSVNDGNGEKVLRQPLAAPIRLSDAMETSIFQVMRQPGEVFRVEMVDPLLGGTPGSALVTFEGTEEVELPEHLRSGEGAANERMATASRFNVLLGPIDSSYWMLDSGRVYRREIRFVSRSTAVLRSTSRRSPPMVVMELKEPIAMRERWSALRQLPPEPKVDAAALAAQPVTEALPQNGLRGLLGRGALGLPIDDDTPETRSATP